MVSYTSMAHSVDRDAYFGLGFTGFLLRSYSFLLIQLAFLILLLVKLEARPEWNWWVVLVPAFFFVGYLIFSKVADAIIFCGVWRDLRLSDDEVRNSRIKKAILFSFLAVAFLSFLILLGKVLSYFYLLYLPAHIRVPSPPSSPSPSPYSLCFSFVGFKLSGKAEYPITVAFIPVFVFSGFLLCCTICCSPLACCLLAPSPPPPEPNRPLFRPTSQLRRGHSLIR
jgi:hypothetical protein